MGDNTRVDMPALADSTSPQDTPSVPASLARLVSLRWLSVVLMLGAGLVVAPLSSIDVPQVSILLIATTLAIWNLVTRRIFDLHQDAGAGHLFFDLTVDLMAWSSFLYLTGGATNPMISLLLPLIAVGATVLPGRLAWPLATLAVCAYSWLWTHHLPLGMTDPSRAVSWHLGGMWATFAVSAGVIVWYITRMTRAVRTRDQALANAREHRMRNERVVALANLAAGAAHELGTPLGTMRLLVDELKREITDGASADDLQLMAQQIDQCKTILSRLTAAAGHARAEGPSVRPVKLWLDQLLATLLAQRPGVELVRADADPDAPVGADVAFDQAIRNLVSNAVTASKGKPVRIETRRRGALIDLAIADQGPGLPPGILDTLHQFERREQLPTEGLGIGLLLTLSSIEHCGGSLEYDSRPGLGTVATVTIPVAQP